MSRGMDEHNLQMTCIKWETCMRALERLTLHCAASDDGDEVYDDGPQHGHTC